MEKQHLLRHHERLQGSRLEAIDQKDIDTTKAGAYQDNQLISAILFQGVEEAISGAAVAGVDVFS